MKPGDVSLLVPDVDEIHAMDNFSDRATFEIHVYGQDLVGLERCQFNLDDRPDQVVQELQVRQLLTRR